MKLLAKHPYIKIERKIVGIEQMKTEHQRTIYLYDEKIVTEYREFPIKTVTDMSFKPILNEGGMLYLHTSQGVFMYQVKQSPIQFIEKYKSYCQ